MPGVSKVLVADDDRDSLLKLKRFLEEEIGVETIVATDGEEAWRMFQENTDLQFVISDWLMPGCDGPELCGRIRAAEGRRYTYFILLTGKTEQDDVVAGMASGADDYIRKPFDPPELQSRIRAGVRVIALEQELAAQKSRIETTLSNLQDAVGAASRAQLGMLPSEALLALIGSRFGLTVAYRHQSCEGLGGDVLGLEEPVDNTMPVFLGDVSGHGIAPSLYAVSLNSFIRANLYSSHDPIQVITQANNFCCSEMPEGIYTSLVYVTINTESRLMKAIVAGHPAILLNKANGELLEIGSTMPPLGLFPTPPEESDVVELTVDPGDVLVLYTDGVTESRNAEGEMFGTERLAESIRRRTALQPAQLIDQLFEEISAWVDQGNSPGDDMTVLVLAIR